LRQASPGPIIKGAVAAGLKLLRATGNIGKTEPWLPIGIGVHSGRVFLGSIGSHGTYEFAALGDAMNCAARLLSAAREGELVMSERYGSRSLTKCRLKHESMN
jgi:adenylate cyclase